MNAPASIHMPADLRSPPARATWMPAAIVLTFAFVLILAGPAGYRGGGNDDFHYLEAARCAVARGFCAPETHWAARWTLVLPLAAAVHIAGEGRTQLAIVPLIYGLAALALLVGLVGTRYGPRAGTAAGLALAATPAFGLLLLSPGVDLAELAFLLGALACLARPGPRWAACAGVLLALAVQTQPSALCAVPMFAYLLLRAPKSRTRLAPALLGLAIPIMTELAVYASFTGDALTPWRLALAHGTIPSTELAAHVDLGRSPLFNPEFIGGWRPASGIAVHWTISGLVNLLAHPAIGLTLSCAAALLLLARRMLTRDRLPVPLLCGAALYFGGLVYALAIDPKPRMFLPVAAAASALVGIAGDRLWREGKPAILSAVLASLCGWGVFLALGVPDLRASDRLAATWLAAQESVSLDATTARALTLVARRPAPPIASAALALGDQSCTAALRSFREPEGWTIARAAAIPTNLDRLTGRPPRAEGLTLCLFRRDRTATGRAAGPPR